jgi:hypothetical protein
VGIGFAHIIKLRDSGNADGVRGAQYQFTFNEGGNTFGGVYDEPSLLELLQQDIGMRENALEQAMSELRQNGHVLIKDFVLSENGAAFFGLSEAGSDY